MDQHEKLAPNDNPFPSILSPKEAILVLPVLYNLNPGWLNQYEVHIVRKALPVPAAAAVAAAPPSPGDAAIAAGRRRDRSQSRDSSSNSASVDRWQSLDWRRQDGRGSRHGEVLEPSVAACLGEEARQTKTQWTAESSLGRAGH